jgi:hypothetical protein
MKMHFGKLAVLGAVLAASAPFASADSINGVLNFTSAPSSLVEYDTTPTLTFNGVSGGTAQLITGSFSAAGITPVGSSASFTTPITLSALPGGVLFTATSLNGATATFTATSDSYSFGSPQGFLDVDFYGTITLTGGVEPIGGYTTTAGILALETNDLAGAGYSSYSGTLTATPAPEPSSLILLGSGLLGSASMLVRRRRTV